MRFADSLFRLTLIGALGALASGCAILTGPETAKSAQTTAQTAPAKQSPAKPEPAKPEAAKPAAGSATSGAKAPASGTQAAAPTAAGAVAEEVPPVEVETPVSPAVQRAFEAGRQALIGGRLDDAERQFLALTRSNPELGGPYANLGVVYRQKQKLEESVASLEKAVQVNPKNAVFFNQLGISYRMVGQFTKSRDAYEKAIALDPNYTLALLNLGILYDVYLWDGKRALELYDRYLSLSPNGDDKVKKWATDLRNRNQPRSLAARKDQG
jgi:tetratricopeptide (TPR) repeat protein